MDKHIKKYLKRFPEHKKLVENFKGRTFVFGYGSLVGVSGINGRFMRKFYTEKDLREVVLHNYKRETNARPKLSNGQSYCGISYCLGHNTNGVLFEVDNDDMFPFKLSEGFGYDELRPYDLCDVTEHINITKELPAGSRVLTCVTRNKTPNNQIFISQEYRMKVHSALRDRSVEFKRNFWPKL